MSCLGHRDATLRYCSFVTSLCFRTRCRRMEKASPELDLATRFARVKPCRIYRFRTRSPGRAQHLEESYGQDVLTWYPFINSPKRNLESQRQELSAGHCRRKPGRQRKSSRTVPEAVPLKGCNRQSSCLQRGRTNAQCGTFLATFADGVIVTATTWNCRALKLRAVSTGLVPIRTSKRQGHTNNRK